jgi:hypothetical protein
MRYYLIGIAGAALFWLLIAGFFGGSSSGSLFGLFLVLGAALPFGIAVAAFVALISLMPTRSSASVAEVTSNAARAEQVTTEVERVLLALRDGQPTHGQCPSCGSPVTTEVTEDSSSSLMVKLACGCTACDGIFQVARNAS